MRFFALVLLLLSTGDAVQKQKSLNAQQQQQSLYSMMALATDQPEAKAAQNYPYDPRLDCLYRAYLASTIFGVVVAFGGIYVIYRQTKATEIAANAARDNALAVMQAERAWVMVSLEHAPGYGKEGFLSQRYEGDRQIDTTALQMRVVCKNDGSTPAWIFERRAVLLITGEPVANEPRFDIGEVADEPVPISVGSADHWDVTPDADGRETQDNIVLVYGRVLYRDAFGKNRETRFGYRVQHGHLKRLSGYPKYNENT